MTSRMSRYVIISIGRGQFLSYLWAPNLLWLCSLPGTQRPYKTVLSTLSCSSSQTESYQTWPRPRRPLSTWVVCWMLPLPIILLCPLSPCLSLSLFFPLSLPLCFTGAFTVTHYSTFLPLLASSQSQCMFFCCFEEVGRCSVLLSAQVVSLLFGCSFIFVWPNLSFCI